MFEKSKYGILLEKFISIRQAVELLEQINAYNYINSNEDYAISVLKEEMKKLDIEIKKLEEENRKLLEERKK